ncbi:MAG: FG-GAP repeat domain-containing protein, partial [Ardenticatenaceae bacterium]
MAQRLRSGIATAAMRGAGQSWPLHPGAEWINFNLLWAAALLVGALARSQRDRRLMFRLKILILYMMVLLPVLLVLGSLPPATAQGVTMTRLSSAGGGIFVDSGQALGGETGNGVALGDLDGDGDTDAFVANEFGLDGANQLWFNKGDGVFASGPTLGATTGNAAALGDLDEDGDLDAIVAMLSPISAMVWMNQGGAQGGNEGDFAPGISLGSFSGYGVAIGDVDNDGDLDALVVGNSNQVWLNNGDATFSAGPALPFLFSEAVALADLDDDGWLDAAIADSGSGTSNRVYWNDGNWEPGPGSFTQGDALPTGSLALGVAVANLDADDQPDIFLAASGQDQVYWNEGARNFTAGAPLPVSDSSTALAVADVDGDGLLDAVVGNIHAEPNRVWRNKGGRTFAVIQEFGDEFGLYWSRGLGLSDLNGDGSADLFEV